MKHEAYQEMFAVEDGHWWFVARRRIVQKILRSYCPDARQAILEIGCGTGGNLELLAAHGNLCAMELDEQALSLAESRKICPVRKGALPGPIPFAQTFDLICLLDVLEHITDDCGALQAARSNLSRTGKILVTVPAYQFLWSVHDVELHHKRRYKREELVQLLRQSGYNVIFATYFNTMLFPLIAGIRIFGKLVRREAGTDVTMPSPLLNRILLEIFSGESCLLPAIPLPFGVSILALAEKTKADTGSWNTGTLPVAP